MGPPRSANTSSSVVSSPTKTGSLKTNELTATVTIAVTPVNANAAAWRSIYIGAAQLWDRIPVVADEIAAGDQSRDAERARRDMTRETARSSDE